MGDLRWWLFSIVVFLFCKGCVAQIRYSISEEQKDGAVVGNIAKDLGIDPRILRERGFRIVSSGESLFLVNQNDGVLHVNGKIDREEVCDRSSVCLINLKLVLDNPLEIHYIAVEILDINDHTPDFVEKVKKLEISESALPGARFQLQPAQDADAGTNSVQQYKLSQNEHFRIEVKDRAAQGKIPFIVLQKQLDRESIPKHKLIITASDGGKPPKTGTMEISVDVLDINDNSPVFTKDAYSASLNENAPIGTTVMRVNATDLDNGPNAEVFYAFSNDFNSKFRELFDIDAITGDIIVKGPIDFEDSEVYEIDIQASDKGLVPLTTGKSVLIKIVDINDNAPEIEVTSFSSAVPEDARIGTTVALISVNDLDSGINGKVVCSLPEDLPFKLTPSLQDNVYSLVTKSPLDRENTFQYDITLRAKDEGRPSLTSEKTITVLVSDVNDNSPEFPVSSYTFYVKENNVPGEPVFSVSASDRDTGDNALVTYQICRDCGDNPFVSSLNINPENGKVYALKSFDFENMKTFHFHVLATDAGSPSLTSNATINVFILDENDNAPKILFPVNSNGSAEGVEELPRNVNPGHLVTKVRAYDADVGYNGWLLFSLQEVTDHTLFGLDRYTGQIRTMRSFTETDESEHKLIIIVKDNGNISLSATATVGVKVVEPKEAFAASDNKSVAQGEDENGVTFYLIITLGAVSVLFLVSIIVLVVMQCSKPKDYSSKYLQDAAYDGTLCHSIQYRSGDKRYMLVGPRMSIGSTIVPGSNANTLVIPDRRRRASVEVSTSVRIMNMEQRGHPSWLKTLQWLVLCFVFLFRRGCLGQIRYSISEETEDGAVVGNIAKDLGVDVRTMKERQFRIVSSSSESPFRVNENNGVLHVDGKIDREQVCERSSVCLINLKTVLENPLEIHYVEVEIIDINDHAPAFLESEKRLEITESAQRGARFQLQPAHDPDGGINSVQLYKLSDNDHFRLEVKDRGKDSKIPILVLQKPLDRESSPAYKLVLTAIDGGKPPKSGTVNIIVDVLDVNDNAPLFTEDVYTVTLEENAPIGTTVIQVNASDVDEGLNGEVIYSFGNGVNRKLLELFDLNPVSGEMTVKGHIDFEENDIYEVDIQASDKATSPLTTDKTVTIKIVDINDNTPEIEVTSFSRAIQEDSRPGTTVALISVTDLDSGVNGKVFCSIKDDLPFKLMPSLKHNMYALVTSSLLDREAVSQYDVPLTAIDSGNPPLSSMKTITVMVSDVNDNSPEFSLNPYTFYVAENNVPGEPMFSITASDRDANENAIIRYQICRQCEEESKYTSFLNINAENGEVYALKSFDYETVKTFQFHVLASDDGKPPRESNVTVQVYVLDQNDNTPVILYPVSSNGSYEGTEELARNVNAGHFVTKVRAYDRDVGYNGWLLYSMHEMTDHTLFGLERYTGQIRTLRAFTETDESEHKLVILVKDNGNISLSATATLTIKLVEPKEAFAASDVQGPASTGEENDVTFYLIITLGSVSALFIISIIVLIVMQCSKSPDYGSKYLQDTNYDGTLCHSIQYRSGDKRYMLVGPRMSIGSTIAAGSNANTLMLPDRRRPSGEVRSFLTQPTLSHYVWIGFSM
ncbi:hypothetical protein ACEWY4_026835 [Coilia grayii]|uniref:Cadherin domain-containing protein n=1 Tax=Coilia grayii TaxID=363190 RepID=A0ABD1ITQ8_9TELE